MTNSFYCYINSQSRTFPIDYKVAIMQKILLIEDTIHFQEQWALALTGVEVEIITATTPQEARDQFAKHPDVALIVMDGCLLTDFPNTIDLTKQIRQTFSGPMIAASRSSNINKQLREAGCNYEVDEKKFVPGHIVKILNL